MLKTISDDVWQRYASVARRSGEVDIPLPQDAVYRGSLRSKVDYVLPQLLLDRLRHWLSDRGEAELYYFLTEISASLRGRNTFRLSLDDLSEEVLASANPGVESVLTGAGFTWALGVDHDGYLHVAGPEPLYQLVREWREQEDGESP